MTMNRRDSSGAVRARRGAALIGSLALLCSAAACSSDAKTNTSSAALSAASSTAATKADTKTSTVAATSPPTTTGGLHFQGHFADTVTEGDGYTANVDIEYTVSDVIVDTVDAKPGEAYVIPQATGHVTVTNTTSGHNLIFRSIELGTLTMLWSSSHASAFGDAGNCNVKVRGSIYCAGPRVIVGVDAAKAQHQVLLPPNGTTSEQIQQARLTPGFSLYLGTLDEQHAPEIADLVKAGPPDLVGVSWHSNLSESCVGWTAFLSGAGSPVLDGGSGFQAPDC